MNAPQTDLRQAFAESLHKLLDRHGLPASRHGRLEAFRELVDRPLSTAHRWLSGNGIPDIEVLLYLASIFTCSLDELLGQTPIKRENFDTNQTNRLIFFPENGNADVNIPENCLFDHPNRRLGVVRVAGTEMSGYAEPGDRILFDLDDTKIHSGAVFVLRINGRLSLRRLRVRLDAQVDVLCDNPRFPAETIPPSSVIPAADADANEIGILGRVVAKLNFEPTDV